MVSGLGSTYGFHWPHQPNDLWGYPQGWEPIPDMPAPPGYQWGSFDAGYDVGDGWGNGYGGGFGGLSGPGGPWGSGFGFGSGGEFGGGFRGGYGGGGGPWPGPHGRRFWESDYARQMQVGPGIYANGTMNYKQVGPRNDDGMPGVNLVNSVGGIGAEPGYDYFYPSEHCKVHVMYSENPPWHNDGNYHMRCFHVPVNITTKEMMMQFGCKNDDKEKNALIELAQASDGRWYKGLVIKGDSKDMMKKAISEIGWTKDRNGVHENVVWVWFTSDYKPND